MADAADPSAAGRRWITSGHLGTAWAMAQPADPYSACAASWDLAARGGGDATDLLSAWDQRTARPVADAAHSYSSWWWWKSSWDLAACWCGDATDLLSSGYFRSARSVADAADFLAAGYDPRPEARASHLHPAARCSWCAGASNRSAAAGFGGQAGSA